MKVFISYSSIDRKQANELAALLSDIDVQYFFDQKDITWGSDFSSDITGSISDCSALIVILSPASLKSQWVPFEVGYATALGKRILPYITHPSLDIPSYLQRLHHISDLEDIRSYFLSLLESQEYKQTAEALYRKGESLYNLSKYFDALKAFDKALEVDPKHFLSLFEKGRTLTAIGSFEEAIEIFKEAEKIDPDQENIYTNIGHCLNELRRYSEALPYLDKELKMNPNNVAALTNKVRSLGNLGKHLEGRKVSERILQINPLDDMTWNNIGASYGELGDYERAIEYCTKALEINPNNTLARSNVERYSQLRPERK